MNINYTMTDWRGAYVSFEVPYPGSRLVLFHIILHADLFIYLPSFFFFFFFFFFYYIFFPFLSEFFYLVLGHMKEIFPE